MRSTVRRVLCFLMALGLLLGVFVTSVAAGTLPFADVNRGRWSYDSIQTLYINGIVSGKSTTTFAPTDPVTRAEFVKMLSAIAQINENDYEGLSFADLKPMAWYVPAVNWAAEVGITSGVSAKRFAPNAQITRQDMAVMICRFAEKTGVSMPIVKDKLNFMDQWKIASYAVSSVTKMQRANVISGIKGKGGYYFEPTASATREQAAQMLCILFELAQERGDLDSLLSFAKPYNRSAKVGLDPDKTGFVINGTTADLKGKTLTLFTAVDYSMFGYYNASNKYVTEWGWFKEVKSAYGVTIKYVRCSPGGNNVIKPYQAMAAGKEIDLVTTDLSSFPYINNILAPLEEYYDFARLKQTPGLDPQLTNLTRWKKHRIVIAPALTGGGFNYNASFIKEAGLPDPYEQWKNDKWNWTTFKKYMCDLPDKTIEGKTVYGCGTWSQFWLWANTNGKPCFEIDGDSLTEGIINNFDSAEARETFVWLESVCDAGGKYWNGGGGDLFYNRDATQYLVMNYGAAGVDRRALSEENAANDYRWVPFPKNEKNSKAVNSVSISGRGIALPKKTADRDNRKAAAVFAQLWCMRFAEARYDQLIQDCGWTYRQVKEYYDLSKTNGRLGLGSGLGQLAVAAGSGPEKTDFNESITAGGISTATCMNKLSKRVPVEIKRVHNLVLV